MINSVLFGQLDGCFSSFPPKQLFISGHGLQSLNELWPLVIKKSQEIQDDDNNKVA